MLTNAAHTGACGGTSYIFHSRQVLGEVMSVWGKLSGAGVAYSN